jgi:hypothetical protein
MATEKRLIDANELLAEVVKVQALEPSKAVAKIIMYITEADGVKVVRCKDCKHYNTEFRVCEFWHGARSTEHYCGEGVHRNDDV